MPLRRIETKLKQAMGLNAASIGSLAIRRAVENRMEKLQLHDLSCYADKLVDNEVELAELIELVVVPETWFFRDMHPFSALTDALRKQNTNKLGPVINILSIPCSTGEEPYTIVMALDQAGFTLDRIRVDAVDISARNIDLAKCARYSNNSFRGDKLDFRDRYFRKIRDGYQLKPEIHSRVSFQQDNVLHPRFSHNRPRYDVIFCRNLLIYFDRETQARVVDILEKLLTPDGLLFLGHAEAGVLNGRDFKPLPYPCCFGFRRHREPCRVSMETPAQTIRQRPLPMQSKPTPEKKTFGNFFIHADPTDKTQTPAADSETEALPDAILKAEQLANEGHLVEAAALCESHIEHCGNDPYGYYLLGLIREATGESTDAMDYLRKAVYLDPQHVEAMTHLVLLLSKQGHHDEAARFQQRAARISQRQANKT